jgi:hypothetical protein
MFKKIVVILVAVALIVPTAASAFWGWPWFKSAPVVTVSPVGLTEVQKQAADQKYQLWTESFDQEQVDKVIANRSQFRFSPAEISYLFANQGSKLAKPLASNVVIVPAGSAWKVSGDIHKFISGQLSFTAQILTVNNRLRIFASEGRYLGIPVPISFVDNFLNGQLDKYFSFLYNDSRYKNISVANDNGEIVLNLEFK